MEERAKRCRRGKKRVYIEFGLVRLVLFLLDGILILLIEEIFVNTLLAVNVT